MNTASLENCQRLYGYAGDLWLDETAFVWATMGDKSEPELMTISEYRHGSWWTHWPAYDLGYLLRKLPAGARLTRNKSNPLKLSNYRGEWSAGLYSTVKLADGQQADNPEDAVCKLAIKLFEEGILSK